VKFLRLSPLVQNLLWLGKAEEVLYEGAEIAARSGRQVGIDAGGRAANAVKALLKQ
jgi:hypothetical protein